MTILCYIDTPSKGGGGWCPGIGLNYEQEREQELKEIKVK